MANWMVTLVLNRNIMLDLKQTGSSG